RHLSDDGLTKARRGRIEDRPVQFVTLNLIRNRRELRYLGNECREGGLCLWRNVVLDALLRDARVRGNILRTRHVFRVDRFAREYIEEPAAIVRILSAPLLHPGG